MSGGIAGATPLEEQIDDVHAVTRAAGSEQPVVISMTEGCALAVLFAASHPDLVRALVLITATPRVVRGPGYEWAQSVAERACSVRRACCAEPTTSGSMSAIHAMPRITSRTRRTLRFPSAARPPMR
jgi:pimeloyl-ACP methyl ester carboxylesterase